MEPFTADQTDIFLMVGLAVCVAVVHDGWNDRRSPGSWIVAGVVGFITWTWLAVTVLVQALRGGIEDGVVNVVKIVVLVGVAIWYVVKVVRGAKPSGSSDA